MPNEVRDLWLKRQREDLLLAHQAKQPNEALANIASRYRRLSSEDLDVVNGLLAEEVVSDNETSRFVALALIREFKISSALPALRQLADRLETQASPGAPYEWAKVNRLIATLMST